MKNHFIFLIILFSATIAVSTLFVNNEVSAQTNPVNQTVAITTTIDPITLLTNELMPLLDTSAIGNLTSLTVTTNLPCDTSNVPKIKIIAGVLGNTTNVIDSSSDYTNNKGPRDTCVFTDKVTNVTAKGIPAMNRVFLKNTGSTPVHIPEGVMVTLTGIFGKSPVTVPPVPTVFQDDYTTDSGWIQTGTQVVVDGGDDNQVDWNAATSGTEQRVAKSIGITLSTIWRVDFDYFADRTSSPDGAMIVVSSETTNWRTDTSDFIQIQDHDNGNGNYVFAIVVGDGGTRAGCGTAIPNVVEGQYYTSLIRDGNNVSFYLYPTSARETPSYSITNCDISAKTITGLDTIQHGVNSDGASGTIDGHGDNLKVWNGVTSPP